MMHNKVSCESTLQLIKQLIARHTKETDLQIQEKDKQNHTLKLLKIKCFAILLSHRKDWDQEIQENKGFNWKLTETELLQWEIFRLVQKRRYNEADCLSKCVACLKKEGSLESNSDVRAILHMLLLLKKPCSPGHWKASLQPRIIPEENDSIVLPKNCPPFYGDHSFDVTCWHYTSFHDSIFSSMALSLDVIPVNECCSNFQFWHPTLHRTSRRFLGAFRCIVSVDTKLSIPELPDNPFGYSCFASHYDGIVSTYSKNDAVSDEGYESTCSNLSLLSHCDQPDPWEEVLKEPRPDKRRTWQLFGEIFPKEELPFITECGKEIVHSIAHFYNNLWSSVSGQSNYFPLVVTDEKFVCNSILQLMIGVESSYFHWNNSKDTYIMEPGLCISGITPECLSASLVDYIKAGTHFYRLEVLCKNADTRSFKKRKLFAAVHFKVTSILQTYRLTVLKLYGENQLLRLLDKTRNFLKIIFCLAQLCGRADEQDGSETSAGCTLKHFSLFNGLWFTECDNLTLICQLQDELCSTQCGSERLVILLLLMAACQPFLSSLSKWMYEGIHSSEGDSLISEDVAALLCRDRTFWLCGYQMNLVNCKSEYILTIMKRAFACGKALHLLRVCKPKHYLLYEGGMCHPQLNFCCGFADFDKLELAVRSYRERMNNFSKEYEEQLIIQRKFEEGKRTHKRKLLSEKTRQALAVFENQKLEKQKQLREEKLAEMKVRLEDIRKHHQWKEEERACLAEDKAKFNQELELIEHLQDLKDAALIEEIKEQHMKSIKFSHQRQVASKLRLERTEFFASSSEDNSTVSIAVLDNDRLQTCQSELADKSPDGEEWSTAEDKVHSVMSTSSDAFESPLNDMLSPLSSQDTLAEVFHKSEASVRNDSGLSVNNTCETYDYPILASCQNNFLEADVNKNKFMAESDLFGDFAISKSCLPHKGVVGLDAMMIRKKILAEEFGINVANLYGKYHNDNISNFSEHTTSVSGGMDCNANKDCSNEGISEDKSVIELLCNSVSKEVDELNDNEDGDNIKKEEEIEQELMVVGENMEEEVNSRLCIPSKMPRKDGESDDVIVPGCAPDVSPSSLIQHSVDVLPEPHQSDSDDTVSEPLSVIQEQADLHDAISESVAYQKPNFVTASAPPTDDFYLSCLNASKKTSKVEVEYEGVDVGNLSLISTYFWRALKVHINVQSLLVNQSLLNYFLNEAQLLAHFAALQSFLLLHDTHFARALTGLLFSKFTCDVDPATCLNPLELNSILNKALCESHFGLLTVADNLSFIILNIPPSFNHLYNVLHSLELQYSVKWPLSVLLDKSVLKVYSKAWKFLAFIHYMMLTTDDMFMYVSNTNHTYHYLDVLALHQVHQLSLFQHEIHHLVNAVQSYITNQVLQVSWRHFEKELTEKVTSVDHLYDLHASYINSFCSKCFLTKEKQPVQHLLQQVFTLVLSFHSVLTMHSMECIDGKVVHPAFQNLQKLYKEFQQLALFMQSLLTKAVSVSGSSYMQNFVLQLDFSDFYQKS